MYVRDSMKQLVIFAALLLLLMMTSTVVFQSRSLYAYVRIDISDILQQQDSQVSQCIYCSSLSCTVPFTASFLGPGWGVLRYLNVLAVLIRSYCRTPAFYYDWWWLPPPPTFESYPCQLLLLPYLNGWVQSARCDATSFPPGVLFFFNNYTTHKTQRWIIIRWYKTVLNHLSPSETCH